MLFPKIFKKKWEYNKLTYYFSTPTASLWAFYICTLITFFKKNALFCNFL